MYPVLLGAVLSVPAMTVVGMIPFLASEKVISYPVTGISEIVIIIGCLVALGLYLFRKKRGAFRRCRDLLGRSKKLLLLVLVFDIAVAVMFFSAMAFIIPPFQIVSPSPGAGAGPVISVAGDGAIPGNPVSVWVIDDLGKYWLQGEALPTNQGTWILTNVRIGREGSDTGKMYMVFARTLNGNGKEVSSNSVEVIRK